MFIISILIFLIILTVIVSLHELGHFLTAKKFGVYCKEFAIGMGPKLWQKQKDETSYTIRAIPMGGFVQMIGEDGELFSIQKGDIVWLAFNDKGHISEVHYKNPGKATTEARVVEFRKTKQPMKLTYIEAGTQKTAQTTTLLTCYDADGNTQDLVANDRQFNYLPPLKKIVVLTAGVLMNFALAFVVVFVATWIGGVTVDPIIATDTATDVSSQFEAGDTVIKIDEQQIQDADTLTAYVRANSGKNVQIIVERQGQEVVLTRTIHEATGERITDAGVESFTYGMLGVTYQRNHIHLLKIFQTAVASYFSFFEYVGFVLVGLFTGKISVMNLTGFVGIAQQTNNVITMTTPNVSVLTQLREIVARLFNFTAFLSVNIGVMNILPFPALDGGRVVFALYELIFRRKPNPKFETYFNAAGFVLLIVLFFGVTILDIMRLGA